MTISGDIIGFICVNVVFYLAVVMSIVTYIKLRKHPIKALIGLCLVVMIAILYGIIILFFRSSSFIPRFILDMSPIAIVVPIYHLTIKPEVTRTGKIFWA